MGTTREVIRLALVGIFRSISLNPSSSDLFITQNRQTSTSRHSYDEFIN